MNDYYYDSCEDLTEAEKIEIYDYEYNKPLIIEQEIKNKNLHLLRDDIFIYASRVKKVLYEQKINLDGTPDGLKNIMNFLNLAIETNNLHILKTVWSYGIEAYFHYNPWESPDILMFVADLISNDETPYKILSFFIKQIKTDDKYCLIKINEKNNIYSGLKRQLIYGNLLGTAVYSNNIDAVMLLLPKQPQHKKATFQTIAENMNLENISKYKNSSFSGSFIFTANYNNKTETLFSYNPTLYAFDNGNVEALEILLENGYKIDFTAVDFSYQIANFGHKNTIDFLIKNYKEDFAKVLCIKDILNASNYPLLRFYIKYNKLNSDDFNHIFVANDDFQFDANYRKIHQKNIKKCIHEFAKLNIKIINIDVPLRYSIYAGDMELTDLCMNLYSPHSDYMDITGLFSCTYLSKELLLYLSEKTKLICYPDELQLSIRDFQYYLKYIDFKFNNLNSINALTKYILSKNSVTGMKLLIKHKFINSNNYSLAVDYILSNDSDKLITTLITYSKELGGSKKSYDI